MIERDEWLRVISISEDRALEFFGYTRRTADVKVIEKARWGNHATVYGVRPKRDSEVLPEDK